MAQDGQDQGLSQEILREARARSVLAEARARSAARRRSPRLAKPGEVETLETATGEPLPVPSSAAPSQGRGDMTGVEDVLQQRGSELVEGAATTTGLAAGGAVRLAGKVGALYEPGQAQERGDRARGKPFQRPPSKVGAAADELAGKVKTGAAELAAEIAPPQPLVLETQGAVGRGAGMVARGLGSTLPALAAAPAGLAGMAAVGFMANAEAGRDDALQSGASEEQAETAFWLNGLAGLSEAVPLSRTIGRLATVFSRANRASGGRLRAAVRGIALSAGEEGTQEAFQRMAGNAIAADLARYDPDRELWDGVLADAAVGAVVGGLLGAPGLLVLAQSHPAGAQAEAAGAPAAPAQEPQDALGQESAPQAVQAQAAPEAIVEAPAPGPPESPAGEVAVERPTEPGAAVEAQPEGVQAAESALQVEGEPTTAAPSQATPEGATPQETTEESAAVPPLPATLAEFERAPTSIKNAVVDRELAEMGRPPATHAERLSFEQANEGAAKRLEADPFAGASLLDELKGNERAVSGEEAALLARERNRLRLARDSAELALIEAGAKGEDTAPIEKRIREIQERFVEASDIVTRVGTKTAQGLALRRLELKEDYSLAAMEQRKRVANKGAALTAEQQAEVRALHAKLVEAEQRETEILAKAAAREADLEAENATLRLKQEVRARVRTKPVLEFVTAQADAARARRKARGTRAMAGIDPFEVADLAIIGAEKIVKGAATFATWSAEMVKEAGEAIRPHLREVFDAALETLERMAKQAKKPASDEPAALKAYKTRIENEIVRLREKIARGDFTKPVRRKLTLDAETIKAKAEVEKVRREFERGLRADRMRNRSRTRKIGEGALKTLDLTKAIKSSWDFSAVLRQGGFLYGAFPIKSSRALGPMFRATFSEEQAQLIDVALRERPLASFGEQSGLELTRLDEEISKREEDYRSEWADKIPGVRPSNRAFTTFLNVQRATIFDALVEGHPGMPTPEQGRAYANLVNVATGRGHISPGKAAAAVSWASKVLWSPRFNVSRVQLVAFQPLYRGDTTTRVAALKVYARALASLAAIYTLADLLGASFEWDPRSSDVGQIRFGNTRIDPLVGIRPWLVLTAKFLSGERKTSKGNVIPIRGDVPYGQPDAWDVAWDFARTKLSPTVAQPLDLYLGKNLVGEQVTPASAAVEAIRPLSFSEIADAMTEHGMSKGAAFGILAIFGLGLNTYDPNKPKPKKPRAPRRPAPPVASR